MSFEHRDGFLLFRSESRRRPACDGGAQRNARQGNAVRRGTKQVVKLRGGDSEYFLSRQKTRLQEALPSGSVVTTWPVAGGLGAVSIVGGQVGDLFLTVVMAEIGRGSN